MQVTRDPQNECGLILDLTDEFVDYRRSQVAAMVEYLQRYARTSVGRVVIASAIRGLCAKARKEAA